MAPVRGGNRFARRRAGGGGSGAPPWSNAAGPRVARTRTIANGSRVGKLVVAFACSLSVAGLAAAAGGSPRASSPTDATLARELARIARPLTGNEHDYDRLLAAIGDARIVLLGEDTHGTREHYIERARITQRLIAERGFSAVVIEGDAVPAAIVDDALRAAGSDYRLDYALRAFDRFPLWMWRNDEFTDLLRWIRARNLAGDAHPVLLAGMDVYDLARPAAAVIAYLEEHDVRAADRARARYACFAAIDMDPQRYGEILGDGSRGDCSGPVREVLTELATMAPAVRTDGSAPLTHGGEPAALRARFDALQGARALVAAEEYFRAMFRDPAASWNVRDSHMAAAVTLLLSELAATSPPGDPRPGIVVWAHNSHIGDGRATNRADMGHWTIGQLLRERFGVGVFSVGFTTARGSVHAATEWGEPGMAKRLLAPLPSSHAALFEKVPRGRFYVVFADSPTARSALMASRPQRGIGVRYLPAFEREGHYYPASLPMQFDAVVHIGTSSALHPRITE